MRKGPSQPGNRLHVYDKAAAELKERIATRAREKIYARNETGS
jgi:hypothetical protein